MVRIPCRNFSKAASSHPPLDEQSWDLFLSHWAGPAHRRLCQRSSPGRALPILVQLLQGRKMNECLANHLPRGHFTTRQQNTSEGIRNGDVDGRASHLPATPAIAYTGAEHCRAGACVQGKGRSSALGMEKPVHALISRISPLSLETGNLPFPMKAFCPCAALQVHQGKLPVTEFQAQPVQADTGSPESAPCKPCTSQFLHPSLPPFPTRQSVSSTPPYNKNNQEPGARLMEEVLWAENGTAHPPLKHQRLASSARAESRKWDMSLRGRG
ncbi:uncharacterized protein LOC115345219 isoform X2 [Aquila chrysaetos chrysaetos]|uniref:uncharacterized protein LOC115345219 isoform X2 n=1 Tax=Aquila chrysaetos chrysaetos TaxID=223781 RepID=UPI00117731B2|nr:uncharacterized protein LOC115345219 isoform X2 [Aquila chrysaetos chrysaetos]